MEGLTEIRWHARAGQGAVTAAKSLAESALEEGKNAQAFPDYGPERAGAPLRAYNRISNKPLRIHTAVTNPDIVIILDPTLIGTVNVAEGTPVNAVLVINTPESPGKMRAKLKLEGRKIFTVDATKISIDTLGRAIPNTPMMGAVVKVTGILKLETIIEDIKKTLGKKFPQKIVDANIAAINKAYEEVKGE